MFTESEFRNQLALTETETSSSDIDLASVLRRASRRRRSQQIAIGGATTLAVAGIGVASISGLRAILPQTTSGSASSLATGGSATDGSATDGSARGGALTRAPAEKLNLCGGALSQVAPSQTGLVLTAEFAAAAASSDRISGTVTLTNSGTGRVLGSSAATPAITLSQDGITLWHSNGPMIALATVIDLEPGASQTYPASFMPVRCGVEDDERDQFQSGLPRVSPGVYQVSAAIDLAHESPDGSFLGNDLVTGPTTDVRLR